MDTAYLVSLLPLLACPIGMGLMMWLMMRGHKSQRADTASVTRDHGVATVPAVSIDPSDRLPLLHAQLAEVEAQQAAVAAQLERLAAEDATAASDAGEVTVWREESLVARWPA